MTEEKTFKTWFGVNPPADQPTPETSLEREYAGTRTAYSDIEQENEVRSLPSLRTLNLGS